MYAPAGFLRALCFCTICTYIGAILREFNSIIKSKANAIKNRKVFV